MTIPEIIKECILKSGIKAITPEMKIDLIAWLEAAKDFGVQNDELVENNNKLLAQINDLEEKIEQVNKGLPAWQKIKI